MSSRRVQGFTLVEMVIVVLIISVLAAIAYPAYQNHVIKTRREAAKGCLLEMQQFMERFYTTNLRYDQTTPGGVAVVLPQCQAGQDVTRHYQVAFDGAVTRTAYRLRAVPQGRQAIVDTYCGTMSINNQGVKAKTGGETVITAGNRCVSGYEKPARESGFFSFCARSMSAAPDPGQDAGLSPRLPHPQLLLQLRLQRVVDLQLAGEFVEVGAFHEVLFVGGEQAGEVHLGGEGGGGGGAGDLRWVERLLQFGVQPLLGLRVGVDAAEFAFDQFAFAVVDVAVGLGGGDQGLEDGLAVAFDIGRRQCGRRGGGHGAGGGDGAALLLLVFAVGLVGHDAECGEAAVDGDLAAHLAGLAVAQQQAQRAADQGALAEGAADGALHVLAAGQAFHAAAEALLGGLHELVEKAVGLHARGLRSGE